MIARVAVASVMVLAGCALKTAGKGIQLDTIRPDSVVVASGAVVVVSLRGHGFAPGTPGQNTVMFGAHAIRNVPANDEGTEIRLVIPESLPSGGEAPPVAIDAGPYVIRVRTSTGESNAATVRVFR